MEQTAPTVSPDGNWVWNGTEWLPNTATAAPTYSVPQPAAPKKKHLGLKIAGGVIAGLVVIGIAAGGGETSTTDPSPSADAEEAAPATDSAPAPAPAPEQVEQVEEPSATASQKNALRTAESYLDFSAFSRTGLIEQLEFEGYSTSDATYAVDTINPDWNEMAAQSARDYLDFSGFSRSGLIDQLEFEGFTNAQAVYGVNAAGL